MFCSLLICSVSFIYQVFGYLSAPTVLTLAFCLPCVSGLSPLASARPCPKCIFPPCLIFLGLFVCQIHARLSSVRGLPELHTEISPVIPTCSDIFILWQVLPVSANVRSGAYGPGAGRTCSWCSALLLHGLLKPLKWNFKRQCFRDHRDWYYNLPVVFLKIHPITRPHRQFYCNMCFIFLPKTNRMSQLNCLLCCESWFRESRAWQRVAAVLFSERCQVRMVMDTLQVWFTRSRLII